METYYLSDTIRLFNDKMEYMVHDKFRPIPKRNWHIILNEYGWEKLDRQWILLLNHMTDKKECNSLFGSIDCAGDGNCFYQCIALALNERDRVRGNYYSASDIRQLLSESITESQYEIIISYYRIMKDSSDFDGQWDPYQINSLSEFKSQINKSGHEYWGDHIILQLLMDVLKCNIYIMNSCLSENDYSVYNTMHEYNPSHDSIFLLYENECHFKLVGHFRTKMTSIFNDSTIPRELKTLFKLKI
jgi:hypothetical protein|tara:strand:+ start:817 stop:1551 length:735 start_codon:yes stop_codon:yes gene_type:complete